jgi:hypothetical protein
MLLLLFRPLISSSFIFSSTATALAMNWGNTWNDILSGGPTRWKVDDLSAKHQALSHILKHATTADEMRPLSILCPLAGDDPFVAHAWKMGHSVTSIDIVPAAVGAMRQQFSAQDEGHNGDDEDWELVTQQNPPTKIWKHKSGRATLYEGDVLEGRPELENQFDAVYDKDSFGALDPGMRSAFCERVASYLKDDGILYTEVKFKSADNPARMVGPPFHLEKADLMEEAYFGSSFDYVASLGEVYKVDMVGVQQHGHILKRLAR